VVDKNLILEGMSQEILIKRGCNRYPWEKNLASSTKRRQITGAAPKTSQPVI